MTNFRSINQQYKDFGVVEQKMLLQRKKRVWCGRAKVWCGNYSAALERECRECTQGALARAIAKWEAARELEWKEGREEVEWVERERETVYCA